MKYNYRIKDYEYKLKELIVPNKFIHSINTMNKAIELAKIYNSDVEKAEIAGLLHDCGRLKKNIESKITRKYNIKEIEINNKNLKHSIIGVYVATEYFNIIDIDILNSIRYHTTGRENMSLLEKIIYIADKIEPGRKYNDLEHIRQLAYTNLNEALIISLTYTINYVNEKGLYLNENTIKARDWLENQKK